MSSSDHPNQPSFNDVPANLSGFAALAANVSLNSTVPHNSKASSVQGTSPTNSDDHTKRNTSFLMNFSSPEGLHGSGLSASMMDESTSANSYPIPMQEYEQTAPTNSSTGKKRSRILSAPENKVEDILSQSKSSTLHRFHAFLNLYLL
jgi:hypothetical protein